MKSFFTPIYQRFERVDQSTNLTNLTWWVPGVTNFSCFTPCYSTILPRQAVTMGSNIANFTHIGKPRNTSILGLFCQKQSGEKWFFAEKSLERHTWSLLIIVKMIAFPKVCPQHQYTFFYKKLDKRGRCISFLKFRSW